MKPPKRKTAKTKSYVPTLSGQVPVRSSAAAKPVEVVKVDLAPDRVLHVAAPRDCMPIVAVHPDRNMVEVAAVPKIKKKRTLLQWIFGE